MTSLFSRFVLSLSVLVIALLSLPGLAQACGSWTLIASPKSLSLQQPSAGSGGAFPSQCVRGGLLPHRDKQEQPVQPATHRAL